MRHAILYVAAAFAALTLACCRRPVGEKIVYSTVYDTVYITSDNTDMANVEREYHDAIDSVNRICDDLRTRNAAMEEKLIVANYKLERIRYYNDIAAKNNNIKYLRGWINRVLDNK